MNTSRVLLAVLPADEAGRVARELAYYGRDVSFANSGDEAVRIALAGACDAAFIDLALDGDGLDTARRIRAILPETLVTVLGSSQELDQRLPELLSSRCSCLQKPLTASQVLLALEQANELRRLRAENRMLHRQWEDDEAPDDLVSQSPLMIDMLRQAATIADAIEPVTIYGEPGTEKHIVALYIHRSGRRADGPFIRFTCGRHDPRAEEVALFGTGGGNRESCGRIELAAGGTLFLDGVQNLCRVCQARLLRLVEEPERTPAPAARIICSLPADAELRPPTSLRKDLIYRLNTFSITIPPLAERREDILPLAERFLRRFAREAFRHIQGISPAARQLLEEYTWPGNVVELRETIRCAVSRATGQVLAPEDLAEGPSRALVAGSALVAGPSVEDAERQIILKTLRDTEWNKTEAARRLRITRTTLASRIARYRACGLLKSASEIVP